MDQRRIETFYEKYTMVADNNNKYMNKKNVFRMWCMSAKRNQTKSKKNFYMTILEFLFDFYIYLTSQCTG